MTYFYFVSPECLLIYNEYLQIRLAKTNDAHKKCIREKKIIPFKFGLYCRIVN